MDSKSPKDKKALGASLEEYIDKYKLVSAAGNIKDDIRSMETRASHSPDGYVVFTTEQFFALCDFYFYKQSQANQGLWSLRLFPKNNFVAKDDTIALQVPYVSDPVPYFAMTYGPQFPKECCAIANEWRQYDKPFGAFVIMMFSDTTTAKGDTSGGNLTFATTYFVGKTRCSTKKKAFCGGGRVYHVPSARPYSLPYFAVYEKTKIERFEEMGCRCHVRIVSPEKGIWVDSPFWDADEIRTLYNQKKCLLAQVYRFESAKEDKEDKEKECTLSPKRAKLTQQEEEEEKHESDGSGSGVENLLKKTEIDDNGYKNLEAVLRHNTYEIVGESLKSTHIQDHITQIQKEIDTQSVLAKKIAKENNYDIFEVRYEKVSHGSRDNEFTFVRKYHRLFVSEVIAEQFKCVHEKNKEVCNFTLKKVSAREPFLNYCHFNQIFPLFC